MPLDPVRVWGIMMGLIPYHDGLEYNGILALSSCGMSEYNGK
jgi:hypothetical protein